MADELVKTPPQGNMQMSRPDFIPKAAEGTEHLTKEDIRLPRLSIAQGLSPQVTRGNAKFIQGLSIGDLFNDLTGQIYQQPLEFFVVRADPPRWIEFIPREQGGGVKDLNVQPGDPRTFPRRGPNNEFLQPIATQFYDYVIMLWPSQELIALSMKSTALKVARSFNGLISIRNAPIYTGKYRLTTAQEKNAKGEWPQFVIVNAGWVDNQEQFNVLKRMFDTLKTKNLVIDREPGDDDIPAEATTGESTPAKEGESIPF